MGTIDATALDIKVLIKFNDKTVYKDGINKNYLGTLKTSTLAIRSTTRATTTTTVKTTLSPVLADFAETPKILTNGTTDSTKTEKPPDSPKSKIVNVVFDKTDFQKFKFDYPDALKKSIKFYYAQRSGIIKDKKIPWRGSSALVIFAIIVLKLGYFPLYNKKPSTGLKITFRKFQSKFPGLKLSQLVPYATAMLSTKFQS